MSTNVLSQKVLVLNRGWKAVNVTNVEKAIGKLMNGTAKVIAPDYSMHDFNSWVDNWEGLAKVRDLDESVLRSACLRVLRPHIIVSSDYDGYVVKPVTFSPLNVYKRDKFTCQYCGVQKTKELSMDHIMPKSRGGATNWMNIVLACTDCNFKKADRTPGEAGMPLRRQPFKPKWSQLACELPKEIPEQWKTFVDEIYWNSEIQ
jgi:hypothetical protein